MALPNYIPKIDLADYLYDLPEERIADRPVDQRDRSRLLRFDVRTGALSHHVFADIPDLIPAGALLIVNDTRVVRARIPMRKETGGSVEVMLIDPVAPSAEPGRALAARGEATWRCMIGGLKKMRASGAVFAPFEGSSGPGTLTASLQSEGGYSERGDMGGNLVRFTWEPSDIPFAEVLERVGRVPLPPYIKREATPEDEATYQTAYARNAGAVAAPTAGLHFTPNVLERLADRGVRTTHVTLHVGAGTFAPIKTPDLADHRMHEERFGVSRGNIEIFAGQAALRERGVPAPFVPVGTTSVRVLESLYWLGVKVLRGEEVDPDGATLDQWEPYRLRAEGEPSAASSAFAALRDLMLERETEELRGSTRLLIVPGYEFAACDALITNFHQPESTLILLVAAFAGPEWKRIYREALEKGYRFLSYGDSSLLVRNLPSA